MVVLAILFVVALAGSGTSVIIYPETLQGHGSEFTYFLDPKGSESSTSDVQEKVNDESRSYIHKDVQPEEKTANGMYRNNRQKLDDDSKHNSYRAVPNEKKDNDDVVEYDEPKREEYREEKLDETNKEEEDDSPSKVTQSDDVKEAEGEENDEGNEEKEEINNENESEEVNDDDSYDGSDDKTNENYESSEEHDEFKWPFENKMFGEYGSDKGYDDFDRMYRGFGGYGKFGKYGSLGGYGNFGRQSKFGCLELGHGEYC